MGVGVGIVGGWGLGSDRDVDVLRLCELAGGRSGLGDFGGARAVSNFFSATPATDSLSMRYLSGSSSSGHVRIPIGSAVYQNWGMAAGDQGALSGPKMNVERWGRVRESQ